MRKDKIGGYDQFRKGMINFIVILLREAIPILGAVIVMAVMIVPLLWVFQFHVISMLLLSVLAIFILGLVERLISKLISGQAERLFGKQELYLIDHDLYYTVDIRRRFSREMKCFKIIEIYQIKKTRLCWQFDCLCYETKKSGQASAEEVLEELRQTEKCLKVKKETVAIKRQYGVQSDQRIDGLFKKINI